MGLARHLRRRPLDGDSDGDDDEYCDDNDDCADDGDGDAGNDEILCRRTIKMQADAKIVSYGREEDQEPRVKLESRPREIVGTL